MDKKTLKWFCQLFILLFVPIPAMASQIDVYGGLAYGYSILESNTSSNKDASTAGKLYAGARLVGPLGIEASYYDLGKYNNGDDRIKGTAIAAVGNFDVKTAVLFIKAGVMNWKVKDVPNNTALSGTDTTFGVGIYLPMNRNVVFRTELEHFSKIGKDTATAQPGNDMELLSLGVSFMF